MVILECDKGEFNANGKIYCTVTGWLCGHVKMCQLTNKWHQTEQAKRCPIRERGKNEA